jgi:exopolysaccharide biosynthesis polyprenyl glycosylphosphotransferase
VINSTVSTAAPATALPLHRRRGLLLSERKLLLVVCDLLAVSVAFVAAFNIRTAEVRGAGFYIPRAGTLIAVAVWLLMAQLTNAYSLRTAGSIRATLRVVGTTVMFSTAGLLAVFFAMPYRITRPTILLWVPLAAVLVVAGRLAYRQTLSSTRLAQPIALVATPEVLATIWPDVRQQSLHLYRVQKVVNPLSPGAHEQLATLASSGRIGEVILGVRDDISRDLFASLVRCYDGGLRIRSLADLYEELTGRLLLDQLGHSWLVSLPMRSETSRVYAACKRGVDVFAGLAGMLALGVVLLVVAPIIKLTDGGPVFHRQQRVGKYGRVFSLAKLRTMRVAPDASTHWTESRDPRVTGVGRLLRRLHLDELPQSWNILRGDMSLIGPRPEQPQYVEKLQREVDFYSTRLTVRPGLTGWAQVNFGYGAGVDGTRVKLSYDLYYVKRQSVSLDLLIVARTLLAVLSLGGR